MQENYNDGVIKDIGCGFLFVKDGVHSCPFASVEILKSKFPAGKIKKAVPKKVLSKPVSEDEE